MSMTQSLLIEKAADRLLGMGAIDPDASCVVQSVVEALQHIGAAVYVKVKASDLIDGDECYIRARRGYTSTYEGKVHLLAAQQMEFVVGSALDTSDHPDSFVFIAL